MHFPDNAVESKNSDNRQPSTEAGSLFQQSISNTVLLKTFPSESKENTKVSDLQNTQVYFKSTKANGHHSNPQRHCFEIQKGQNPSERDEEASVKLLKNDEFDNRNTVMIPSALSLPCASFCSEEDGKDSKIFQSTKSGADIPVSADGHLLGAGSCNSLEDRMEKIEQSSDLQKSSTRLNSIQAKNSETNRVLSQAMLQTSGDKERHSIEMKQALMTSLPRDLEVANILEQSKVVGITGKGRTRHRPEKSMSNRAAPKELGSETSPLKPKRKWMREALEPAYKMKTKIGRQREICPDLRPRRSLRPPRSYCESESRSSAPNQDEGKKVQPPLLRPTPIAGYQNAELRPLTLPLPGYHDQIGLIAQLPIERRNDFIPINLLPNNQMLRHNLPQLANLPLGLSYNPLFSQYSPFMNQSYVGCLPFFNHINKPT